MSKNSTMILASEIYQQGISYGKMLKYLLFSIFSENTCKWNFGSGLYIKIIGSA